MINNILKSLTALYIVENLDITRDYLTVEKIKAEDFSTSWLPTS